MEGTYRAGADRLRRGPSRCGRAIALLTVAFWGMLHAGSDCVAVSASGRLDSPSTRAAAEPLASERMEARVATPVAHIYNVTTAGAEAADSTIDHDLLARAEPPFLTADARLAGNPGAVARAFPRTLDRAADERTPRVSIRALDPAALALYAAKIDEQAVRVYLPANDFAETGPGTLSASMSGLDVDALRSVAGGRVQLITAASERGRVLAEARLSWLFEYLQTEADATAFYSPGDKGIFAVQGLNYGSNWALVGIGLRWELVQSLSAYVHYDAQANRQQLFHIGSGGVSYAW
jgi:hypothetical protein